MEPEVINTYGMMHETKSGHTLGDVDAHVVLVVLANSRKNESDLKSTQDQWLYACNPGRGIILWCLANIPSYKHVNDINLVGGKSNPGLAACYRVLNKDNVHNLETVGKDIAQVSISLEALAEEQTSEGRIA